MKLRHAILAGGFLLAALHGLGGAATAVAAPAWNLDVHHYPTNVAPGGTVEYRLDVRNVGDSSSSGQTAVTVSLPAGFGRSAIRNEPDFFALPGPAAWTCPGSPGETTVVCTTTAAIARRSLSRSLVIVAAAAPDAGGTATATAEVSGGGAVASATAFERAEISSMPARFGIVADGFAPDFVESDGVTEERRSGAHPDLFRLPLDFNSLSDPTPGAPLPTIVGGTLHDLVVDLPPGLIGTPAAADECRPVQFIVSSCPGSSQVGRLDAAVYPFEPGPQSYPLTTGVFNLLHARGNLADFGFSIFGRPAHIQIRLDPARNYALQARLPAVNEAVPVFDQVLSFWGVPADSEHDSERCPSFSSGFGNTSDECDAGTPRRPFLTLPSDCGKEASIRVHDYDSWQNRGVFGPPIDYRMPGQISDCLKPPFVPRIEVEPGVNHASSPTGLGIRLILPQDQDPDALATPPVKQVTVALPEGVAISSAAADSLESCSPDQIALGTNEPVACPATSGIGRVSIRTPLLPEPLEGSIYLATQGSNPFDSLLAFYLTAHDSEERGVLLKIPGRLDLDPQSGDITASFDDLPELPFDELALEFRGGQKAPFVNPSTCGPRRAQLQAASFARPGEAVSASHPYQLTDGPGSHPCPSDPTRAPFSPQLQAGATIARAGAFSPFAFRIRREDQDQRFGQVTVRLPAGVSARLAGIPSCSETAIAAIPRGEGSGRSELDRPSCPRSSQIGSLAAVAGAGSEPLRLPGKVYLGGSYKGAPISLVAIVPAVAGPLDLGTIALRMAVDVNASTGRLSVLSDSLPTMLSGVPLELRTLRVELSHGRFIRNPTGCDVKSVKMEATSASGAGGSASNRFQVGGCGKLGFKPRVSLRLTGSTHRGAHPGVRVVLDPRPGDANLRRVEVALPRTELLDGRHIRTTCTRARFAADRCPPSSIHGRVKAWSPLLKRPLEGPIFLRESSRRLPDLAGSLGGEIDLDLVAHLDGKGGRLRVTLPRLPDVPLAKVVLTTDGGGRGLLVNTGGVCARERRAATVLTAHSSRVRQMGPMIETDCRDGGGERQSRRSH